MRCRDGLRAALAAWLLCAGVVHAEWCLNYSSGTMSLARQAGQGGSMRGCVATEAECNAARMSNSGAYSGVCYPVGADAAGRGGAGSGPSSVEQAAQASQQAQEKVRKQQAAQTEYEARQAAWARDQLLRGGLKDVQTSSGLTIKLPARSQLDCVARGSANAAVGEDARLGAEVAGREHHADFGADGDCRPLPPASVPPASPPQVVSAATGEVPEDPAQLARFLEQLLAGMQSARQNLARQDSDIARLEAEVQQQRQEPPKLDLQTAKPAESDALRKAREALARAKAEREKTAQELRAMEERHAAASRAPQ